MKKKQPIEFLSDKSLFELERSKGANCIRFIPARIKSYEDSIEFYEKGIAKFKEINDGYKKQLDDLNKKKGIKYLFKLAEIRAKKASLLKTIEENDKTIAGYESQIKEFKDLIEQEKKNLNEIKSEIYEAGLTLEQIEKEYNKLVAQFKGDVEEKTETLTTKQEETKKKQPEPKSAIARFNARLDRHKSLVAAKSTESESAKQSTK